MRIDKNIKELHKIYETLLLKDQIDLANKMEILGDSLNIPIRYQFLVMLPLKCCQNCKYHFIEDDILLARRCQIYKSILISNFPFYCNGKNWQEKG